MIKRIALASVSGVLFSLAWTSWGLGWSLWFAFIPLFYIEDFFDRNKGQYTSIQMFYYSYLGFFIWNSISTWWVSNSTLGGGIAAVVLNTLFYAILFWFFHIIKRKMGKHTGYSALLLFWLAFERLYLNGEISWTWLVLGNGFANNIGLIQWYEFTGTLGGSLWVLLINIMLFQWIQHLLKYKTLYGQYIFSLLFAIVWLAPILLSNYLYHRNEEETESIRVSIIQPNIDPYNEKFGGSSSYEQLKKMIQLFEDQGNKDADFIILPETAIDDGIFENDFMQFRTIATIDAWMQKHPKTSIILGATTRYLYPEGITTPTARIWPVDTSLRYDLFNTALQINNNDSVQVYHKSKLVIGVEMTPYPAFFKLFEDFIINLGGTTGNLGSQAERSVFYNSKNNAIAAPVICYESIYGEFVTEYVQKGANFISIITNDGWWGDTPGYRQHLSFAKLRAIETRRWIARSANTGVSAIINDKGEILKSTNYWVPDVLNGDLKLNNRITYFVKNGDFIGRIAQFFSLLLLLSLFIAWIRNRKNPSV
ncbi:MAG: apolipoprotein N-acyltransferase [Bacteroidales bacterium]|nr:apolipoprotein N-acyltransferase [Bacteroidales bacterium]